MEIIAKGIYKWSVGKSESFTPQTFRKCPMNQKSIEQIPGSIEPIFTDDDFHVERTKQGLLISHALDTTEDIYGFGLQLKSVNQIGKRRYLKVNSDPVSDTGEGHAPVPFYISTKGYGILINTLRYVTVNVGTNSKRGDSQYITEENQKHTEFSESAIYALKKIKEQREVMMNVPNTDGVELFIFYGSVKEIVQRYNLFAGGGCLPPLWGLGMWYRSYGGSDENAVLNLAEQFRKNHIPMDVIGIEPGWQSHSYACTFKWSDQFPNHQNMVRKLNDKGYHINLWEHMFTYPAAPFYKELVPYSGDYEVWNGLVPDFADEKAVQIFGGYHKKNFAEQGISGFKLDECDNSDFNMSNWSYPDYTKFPSGMDGEQMHSAAGILYQKVINDIYESEGQRTYSQVRSSGALASPYPFVLYSDLYHHKDFIRGIVNSGFTGLLWCPEVRDCRNGDDLLRRLQTTVFSAHAMVNAWRIPNPPWEQTDIHKNLDHERMEDADYYTQECRKIIELRMRLLPYIYSAFYEYKNMGIPPVRALVMEDQEDLELHNIDDQYMFGKHLMVCPLTYEEGTERRIYLPKGKWYDFYTKEELQGGVYMNYHAEYNRIPVFVRSGAILPLAEPMEYIPEHVVFDITLELYGEEDSKFCLVEDDFTSVNPANTNLIIVSRDGEKCSVLQEEESSTYRFVNTIHYK